MQKLDLIQLIEAGAHFGHLTRRWNPKMKPYIFMERNGIHIIDLKKTLLLLNEAAENLSQMVSEGKRVLFVGTKRQAKNIIDAEAKRCNSNWVSERWLGGMLTNFATIRKSVKRLNNIEKHESDGTFDQITKKERLFLTREKDKLKRVLEGVESMNRLPNAMFVVDIKKESIAIKEAKRLNIPVFAIVDTNCEPDEVDFIIPANDDAVKTIELITKFIADTVIEGNVKAEQIKAEEAAEKERLKKEREKEKEEEAAERERLKKEKKEEAAEKERLKKEKEKEKEVAKKTESKSDKADKKLEVKIKEKDDKDTADVDENTGESEPAVQEKSENRSEQSSS
ncbi:MAG TPA: 30S ribosomal protein S2 [Ignavibacteria bacterium]|nr:30S ribosomal protein S2 [Ignavibacteria bacterium]